MSTTALADYLAALREEIEAGLRRVAERIDGPAAIAVPVRYALEGPGKRLRPSLTLAAAETVGMRHGLRADEARAMALPAACAVEMIHTYSLVHDDLPAMDNDDLRRGRPTTHIVHGDGLAILAGDGLLTDAFRVLAEAPSAASADGASVSPADRRLDAIRLLAEAAGSRGMVGGQAIDLAAVGAAASLDAAALTDMHARKTGALIRAATVLGALLVGGRDREVAAADSYAAELGLAFQIVDDILDVEGSAADLGKTAGKDAAAGKPTYPALYGLDESRAMAAACIARAHAALEAAGLEGRLGQIADWSLTRQS